jgi:hypothetical protein
VTNKHGNQLKHVVLKKLGPIKSDDSDPIINDNEPETEMSVLNEMKLEVEQDVKDKLAEIQKAEAEITELEAGLKFIMKRIEKAAHV